MFKRVTIVALVVAAFLVLAVPAFAFNGMRGDYTTADGCQICHSGTAGIPNVYPAWHETKHATDEAYGEVASRLPYGAVCQGCHTSNFDPNKLTPVDTGGGKYSSSPSAIASPQAVGTAAWSEGYIGCSSCHYGANMAGIAELSGSDTNDTAHRAPYGDLANADICGACHSRYSYTATTYPVATVPGAATPTPLIQPQMALGYPMLGSPAPSPSTGWNPAAPLSQYLIYPQPGWTPLPDPAATTPGLGRLMTYWQMPAADVTSGVGRPAATDTLWQQAGHDGSAAQYPEWRSEGHAAALTVLTSKPYWGAFPEATKQQCLECHSADFRILKDGGKNPTSASAKYGVTCVGCHAPHDAGTVKGAWDEAFDAQLVDNAKLANNGSNLCTECHNGELPVGTEASPGAEIHHPMKEMMDGYGAIDVAAFPSVHKGKCIQCHMAPTSYSRGAPQLGGNHTFTIITPATANEVLPIPVTTTTAKATALPIPGTTNLPVVTTTVTTALSRMPYSACSTCHDNNAQPATQITSTSATATPTAAPTTVQVTVTRSEMVAGGDKGLWLQDTIDQRQAWTIAKVGDGTNADFAVQGELGAVLDAAALRLGYSDKDAAFHALVKKKAADRTTAETSFLKAVTNGEFVVSEGSFGLHNWDYSRQIVNTALFEARSVEAQPAPAPWSVTFKVSKKSVKKGATVSFTSTVAPADALAFGHATITIQRNQHNAWRTWKKVVLRSDGALSNYKVKMTTKGTYKLRVVMPAYLAHNMLQGISPTVTVKVK